MKRAACDVLTRECYVKHVCAQTSSVSQTKLAPEKIGAFCFINRLHNSTRNYFIHSISSKLGLVFCILQRTCLPPTQKNGQQILCSLHRFLSCVADERKQKSVQILCFPLKFPSRSNIFSPPAVPPPPCNLTSPGGACRLTGSAIHCSSPAHPHHPTSLTQPLMK